MQITLASMFIVDVRDSGVFNVKSLMNYVEFTHNVIIS